MRQIYQSTVIPTLNYGVEAWWNGQKGLVEKLQTLQHQGTRTILGAFKDTPAIHLDLKAATLPTIQRLDLKKRLLALRILRLNPQHSLKERTLLSYPNNKRCGTDDRNLEVTLGTKKRKEALNIRHISYDLLHFYFTGYIRTVK